MSTKDQNSTAPFKTGLNILTGMVFITVVLVGIKYAINTKNEIKISDLEKNLMEMRSAITTDSIRQFNIQKIIAIIDQYNLTMPRVKKYEIAEEIYTMTKKYPVLNVDLLCATITHESAGTWDPEIISPAGAMGLMQIMPATG
ncbi:MAG: hypothetical protein EHM72_11525, partial [Calditrichaeota bacterium]